jgi:hypothetical protein
MQIRISWQLLIASTIFLLSFCVLGRFAFGRLQPARQPTSAPPPLPSVTVIGLLPTLTPMEVTPSAGETTAIAFDTTPTVVLSPGVALTPTTSPTRAPTPTPFVPLAPTPTPAPEPLVLLSQGFGQREGVLAAAFVVNNPNPDQVVRESRYQVVAYDGGGVVLKTGDGVIAAIGPGQQIGVAQNLELPAGVQAARIEVLIRPGLYAGSPPFPLLPAENLALLVDGGMRITAIVRDPLDIAAENVPVVGIVYDSAGRIIGGGNGVIPFIPPGGQAAVEVPVIVSGTPAGLELYPLLQEIPVSS